MQAVVSFETANDFNKLELFEKKSDLKRVRVTLNRTADDDANFVQMHLKRLTMITDLHITSETLAGDVLAFLIKCHMPHLQNVSLAFSSQVCQITEQGKNDLSRFNLTLV